MNDVRSGKVRAAGLSSTSSPCPASLPPTLEQICQVQGLSPDPELDTEPILVTNDLSPSEIAFDELLKSIMDNRTHICLSNDDLGLLSRLGSVGESGDAGRRSEIQTSLTRNTASGLTRDTVSPLSP